MNSWKDWRYCSCFGPCLVHCLKPCFSSLGDEYCSRDCKRLDFSHCNLKDVPDEIFSVERTLEELILDANSIHDLPRVVFHCTGLRKLSLSDNEIETLPNAISSLIYLEYLNLSRNSLLVIPDGIKCCKCLTILDVSVNPLGKLPDAFTQLINLQELYLNDTFLEYLPASFGRLSRLRIVELRENNIKILPKSITRLINLERLDLGQNELIEFPEVLCSLPALQELWIDGNKISALPESIGNLTRLSYLDASENRIVSVASQIGECKALSDLVLSFNKINELPETIGNLKNLTYLRLDDNELTSLPQSIGGLSALQEFVISNNSIQSIPKNIGFLRNLHTLIMDCNQLKELPDTICSCSKLRLLSISTNELSELPEDIGRLNNLRVLNLRNNQLKYLPYSFANITHLQTLWLSDNQQKPIMRLQTDTDEQTGKKVLTCFLLPQQSNFDFDEAYVDDHESEHKEDRNYNQDNKIKFFSIHGDFDEKEDQYTSKLIRNPTPYPKELKAHARHARNLALKRRDSFGNGEDEDNRPKDMFQIGNTSESQDKPSHTEIKEAKLTKALKEQSNEFPENSKSSHDESQTITHPISSSSSMIYRRTSINDLINRNAVRTPAKTRINFRHLIENDRGYKSDHETRKDAKETENLVAGYSSDIDAQAQQSPAYQVYTQRQAMGSSPFYPGTQSSLAKNASNSERVPLIDFNTSNHSAIKNLSSDPNGNNSENQAKIHNFLGTTNTTLTKTHILSENHSNGQRDSQATQEETFQTNLFTSLSQPCYSPSTQPTYSPPIDPSKQLIDSAWEESKSKAVEGISPYLPQSNRPKYKSAPSQVIFQQFSMGVDHISSDYGAHIYRNSSLTSPRQASITFDPRCRNTLSDYESIPKPPTKQDPLVGESSSGTESQSNVDSVRLT